MTPGREEGEGDIKLYTRADVNAKKGQTNATDASGGVDEVSARIVIGLGGTANISDVDCCATRLRCTVKDANLVKQDVLKESGAAGIICKGQGVQIIYGPKVSVIKSNLEDYLDTPQASTVKLEDLEGAPVEKETPSKTVAEENGHNDSVLEQFFSPMKGIVAPITEINEPAFSEKMMGDGVFLIPEENKVYAPCDCEVMFVFPTKHAIGLKTESGLEALIHVGLDTVNLEGEGFDVKVQDGDHVKRGDVLMEFDLPYIKEHANGIETPFLITNLEENQRIEVTASGQVSPSNQCFVVK